MLKAKLLAAILCVVSAGCTRKESFPAIGTKIASPVDVDVTSSGSHFFVLNSDFDRTYGQGSVLVLDKDGEKVGALPVPRMGRFLTVAGNDMLVGIDYQDDDGGPLLLLLDVSDPANPVEKKRWPLECSPLNAELRPGYPYFMLGCTTGQMFLGKLAEDRSQSTMKIVRRYGLPRRALHIDPVRGLIFGFTTDLDKQASSDSPELDEQTYDDQAKLVAAPPKEDGTPGTMPDEIPDERQSSRRALSNRGSWQLYQFFVYDINRELGDNPDCTSPQEGVEDCFPYRKLSEPLVQRELRWLYFRLGNFDGTPDPMVKEYRSTAFKYYRTNFWSARPDPYDPDVFYLSHRGPPRDEGSPHANQIVRVRIVGDVLGELAEKPAEGKPPKTEDVLQFERVYGFAGAEINKYHYPGDFELTEVAGQRVLVVNHFRDLVNWVRGDVYFSLAAKVLDENTWVAETENPASGARPDPGARSWYQVAVNREGRAASCLFYSNAVMLLDVTPGVGITEIKRIQ
jgi:hypothetical protein